MEKKAFFRLQFDSVLRDQVKQSARAEGQTMQGFIVSALKHYVLYLQKKREAGR